MNEGPPGRPWLPVVGWALVILTTTSIPGQDIPAIGPVGLDKLVHILLYLPLSGLALRALYRGRPGAGLGPVALTLLAALLFAAGDEWHQEFVPNRAAALLDWLADAVGIMLGAALVRRPRMPARRPVMAEVTSLSGSEIETAMAAPGVLVAEFYTEGCPACARFGPTFAQLATEYAGRARLVAINARQNMDTAKALQVRGVPTTVVFKDGSEVQRLTGAKTLQEMRDWLAPVFSEQ